MTFKEAAHMINIAGIITKAESMFDLFNVYFRYGRML